MKKLLLIISLIGSVSAFGQTIKEQKIDKFSGVKSAFTTTENLVAPMGVPQVTVRGALFDSPKDKEYDYVLYFTFPAGFRVGSLKEGESEIILLMENGDPFPLTYSGKYNLYSSGERVSFYSRVTPEQLQYLSQNNVTDIRTPGYDYKIKAKQQGVIAKIADLLLPLEPEYSTASTSDTTIFKPRKAASVADEIKKLKDLLDAGAITQEEYDAQKKKLLGQ